MGTDHSDGNADYWLRERTSRALPKPSRLKSRMVCGHGKEETDDHPERGNCTRDRRLGDDQARPDRQGTRLHIGPDRPRDRPARDPDGARDGDGVGLCPHRCLFRFAPRHRRGRNGRTDRGHDQHPVRGCHRLRNGDDGDGRPPHRRKKHGGRSRCGRSVDPARFDADPGGRSARSPVRQRPASLDGRHPRTDRLRSRLHAGPVRRFGDHHAALPAQRGLPRCGRRRDRHARAVDRQRHQHRPRPLPDLRSRAISPSSGSRERRSPPPSAAASASSSSSGSSFGAAVESTSAGRTSCPAR